jgi:quercetin dioxygenase-like cupin family protein
MNHFIQLNKLTVKDELPGATAAYFQTVYSTMAYTEMQAGAIIPLHHHVNEALDIVLEGILEMQIGDKTDTLYPGMMSFVPSNIQHGAKAITDCKIVTVLHPKRQV